MRAAVLHAFREPLSLEEVPEPELPPDGALVEVRATGLCRSDWHGWMGHDDSIALPHVPGHEFAGVLFEDERAGFKIAIPVGLLISAGFAVASAFVDARPGFAVAVVRRRVLLWRIVLGAAAVWLAWTLLELPPLDRPSNEGGTRDGLAALAAIATIAYGISAVRYLLVYRDRLGLLPASIVACFALLSEAMIGVAITGERAWHASWWEWHGLIVLAYVVVAFAARLEWRDERFRNLYLETTRERGQEVSVLFSDLAGFTSFAERSHVQLARRPARPRAAGRRRRAS